MNAIMNGKYKSDGKPKNLSKEELGEGFVIMG